MTDQHEVAIPTDDEIRASLEVCAHSDRVRITPFTDDDATRFLKDARTGYPRALRAVQELKQRLAEEEMTNLGNEEILTQAIKHLANLLAVIHRDGGHYLAEHGMEKAVEDAVERWAEMRKELDELRHQPKGKTWMRKELDKLRHQPKEKT